MLETRPGPCGLNRFRVFARESGLPVRVHGLLGCRNALMLEGALMAEVNDEALTAGIHRGIEVAVLGGLVTAEESRGTDPPAQNTARSLAGLIVERAPEGDMPPWRQMITGELIGTAVVAREAVHTMADLDLGKASTVLDDIWRIIDRW